MYKFIAMYTQPAEGDKVPFEEHYFSTHVPLCHKLPGLVRAEVNRVDGPNAPYFIITELVFNSKEEMNAAWATPEGKAVGKDTRNFPPGLMTTLTASVDE